MHEQTANDMALSRRSFVKWAAAVGGAAALSDSPLVNCAKASEEDSSDTEAYAGNTQSAISDGLPYGADKVVPVLCGSGDVCGNLHTANCYVKDGAVVYYEGCKDGYCKGHLCARGQSMFEIINSPDRIMYPMRRTNEKGVEGEFERITWDEAIDEITDAMAKAINEEGPHTVAVGSSHVANKNEYLAMNRFKALFGFDSSNNGGCYSDLMMGPTPTLGDYYHCLEEDPMASKVIIHWGENCAVAKPQEWSDSFFKAKEEAGAKLIVIDPRFTPSAARADIYLPLRPGTDAYVALAMANVIITEGLEDKDFIEKHTYGYEAFRELALQYTPEIVEQISWAPADKVREIARLYATEKPAMLEVGRGGNQVGGDTSNAGWLMSRAITCLIGLTGNAGMKGGGFSMEASAGTADGLIFHWPMMWQSLAPATGAIVTREEGPDGGAWGRDDHLFKREPYGTRVYITSHNIASCFGDQDMVAEALKKLDCIISLCRTAHWTASAFADYILPVATPAESWMQRYDWEDLMITEPAIDPMYESATDAEIYRRLALALYKKVTCNQEVTDDDVWPYKDDREFTNGIVEHEVFQQGYRDAVSEGYDEYADYVDMTLDDVIAHKEGVPNPFYAGRHDFVPYLAKYYRSNGFVPEDTPDDEVFFPTYDGEGGSTGRLLFQVDWLAQLDESLPALPVPEEPYDSYYADGNPVVSGNWELSDAVKAGYDLVSVGKAHQHWQFLSFNQTWDGGNVSQLLRESFENCNEPCVELNPADADARGLANGDRVTVESQYGMMENIRLVTTQTVMPGTIVPPYHWGNIQNKIYPHTLSFANLSTEQRQGLNPQPVGPFGSPQLVVTVGGQGNQSATLCKIYAYEG